MPITKYGYISSGALRDIKKPFPREFDKKFPGNYLKKEGLLNSSFSWCKGYGVFSVSESVVEKVIKYIKNQDEHHRTKTFREEVQDFLAVYNLEYTEDWFLE
ncbi:MAG: transposase [Candidatus Marinimicrobia bacterium]|nr:transposase [Candidatus Neomarinimicrobiota bacterium]